MLSVAKLTPGQEAYYERSVAAGIDDYYAGRGESPGVWVGKGASELGLQGVVADNQLGVLIRGDHPATGERLRRRHPKARTITIEKIDPATGTRRLEQKTLRPVAGYDLVFSVPKSVSLLHALGDDETRHAVSGAHLAAWQAALAYLEDEACVVRRGTCGIARESAPGFVAAAYQHRTSRAQDPHLHTHVIVANMALRPSDSEWRALDGEAILKTYRLAAGYLYQAHLRGELTRSLGVEWETPRKGMAELRSVPSRVLAEFSTRRAQVVAHLDERGSTGFYAAQRASLDTRERKEYVDLPGLRKNWRARAAEHGFGQAELSTALHRVRWQEPSSRELLSMAKQMVGPEGLTERSTAFSDPDLVMAWAAAHGQGASGERVRRLAERFSAAPGVEQVGDMPAPGRPARYSTTELIAAERDALRLVAAGRGAGAPTVAAEVFEAVATPQRAMSTDQAQMVREVASSPDRVVCVVGLAGAGKTTATRVIGEAFSAAGISVLGGAPSGVAAEKLQDETGIDSTTLYRLLRAEIPTGCLLVIDEAGMADTRILAPLLARVDQAQGKAVLIGDPHQLPAVGAGGLFAGIVERHGAIALTENRRQHDPEERRALEAVRNGVGRDYLAFAEGKGRLIAAETSVDTKARLLADWWASARDNTADNVMVALRRRDVAELNRLGRALMESHEHLGTERLTIADREFAAGDRVVCLRNRDALGIKNGTRGTVDSVDPANRRLVVRTDRGVLVELTAQYLTAGHVSHAYAITGHSGQGITIERAFVLASGGARLQEWGYVALSRARTETRVYLTADAREVESHFDDQSDRDEITRVAQALEESSVERLAVDQRPTSGRPRQTRPEIERPPQPNEQDARLTFIEQQRRSVLEVRADAEQKLQDAERRLANLGRFDRSVRKRELRSEIALSGAVIRGADSRLLVLGAQARGIPRPHAADDALRLLLSDRNQAEQAPSLANQRTTEIGVEI